MSQTPWLDKVKPRLKGPQIVLVNRKPLEIPKECIPIKVSFKGQKIIILCPVNRLNDCPKFLSNTIQADFMVVNSFENNNGLLTPGGKVIVWPDLIHS